MATRSLVYRWVTEMNSMVVVVVGQHDYYSPILNLFSMYEAHGRVIRMGSLWIELQDRFVRIDCESAMLDSFGIGRQGQFVRIY